MIFNMLSEYSPETSISSLNSKNSKLILIRPTLKLSDKYKILLLLETIPLLPIYKIYSNNQLLLKAYNKLKHPKRSKNNKKKY